MISVEEIEQENPQEAAPEEAVQLPAPEPEVIEEPAEAEALDIEDVPPPEPPKKRGRPKAVPKEKKKKQRRSPKVVRRKW